MWGPHDGGLTFNQPLSRRLASHQVEILLLLSIGKASRPVNNGFDIFHAVGMLEYLHALSRQHPLHRFFSSRSIHLPLVDCTEMGTYI